MSTGSQQSTEETVARTAIGDAASATSSVRTSETRDAELPAGASLGRYVILSLLGRGGMGVVYAAYDPQLERRVALKVLREQSAEARGASSGHARLLREARALARLAHPHIVAVHDVGEHESGVFVAMEFVDGLTLSAWAKSRPRTVAEVLEVMRAAGLGLAAAHAAGLVHRDFKPENVMIGSDGRVRVMDFGLTRSDRGPELREPAGVTALLTARAEPSAAGSSLETGPDSRAEPELTALGTFIGTPAYMAPEQFSGLPATMASDQFSFCVSLWELLYGQRPFAGARLPALVDAVVSGRVTPPGRERGVPAWLKRCCLRGLSVDPQARFADMQALIAALDRGRARGRWVRAGVAAVTVACVAGGALAVREVQRSRVVAACEETGSELGRAWRDGARERAALGIRDSQLAYAASVETALMPLLDEYVESWSSTRRATCVATRLEHTLDADLGARADYCLDQSRWLFSSLVAGLERGDPVQVREALPSAFRLPPPSLCGDPLALADAGPAPGAAERAQVAEIAQALAVARTQLAAGQQADAQATYDHLRERIEALSYAPLRADARRLDGEIWFAHADFPAAERAARAAYFDALANLLWSTAAEAATDLARTVGDDQQRYAEGRLWIELAQAALAHSVDPMRTRAARLATNAGHVEMAAGDLDAAQAHYSRSLELLAQAYGDEHPALRAPHMHLGNLARARGRPAQGREHFARAVELSRTNLGEAHPDHGAALHNLGTSYSDEGRFEEAAAIFERSIEITLAALGPDHPTVAHTRTALAGVAYTRGDFAGAEREWLAALATLEKAYGADSSHASLLLNNLGLVARDTGRYDLARERFARVVEIREHIGGPNNARLHSVLYNWGVLEARAGDPDTGHALFSRALTIADANYGVAHQESASTRAELADLELRLGRPAAALALLEAALPVYDAEPATTEAEALARFAMARALVATGGDRARARALAEQARAAYEVVGERSAKERAEVESWLAAH